MSIYIGENRYYKLVPGMVLREGDVYVGFLQGANLENIQPVPAEDFGKEVGRMSMRTYYRPEVTKAQIEARTVKFNGFKWYEANEQDGNSVSGGWLEVDSAGKKSIVQPGTSFRLQERPGSRYFRRKVPYEYQPDLYQTLLAELAAALIAQSGATPDYAVNEARLILAQVAAVTHEDEKE